MNSDDENEDDPYSDDPDPYDDDPYYYDDDVTDDGVEREEEVAMTFLEHLEAFRWTIIYCLVAFVVGAALVLFFIGTISDILQYPLARAYGSVEVARQNLITYRPLGVFNVLIQVIFLTGFILSMPFSLYFLARFVAPALEPKELRVLRPTCLGAAILFLTGVAFSFFLVLPMTLAISVRFNQFFGFDLLFAANEYYSLVVWFSFAMGLFFQFPLIVIMLVYLEVVTTAALCRLRRHVFFGLAVFAALVTPGGDPISLLMMTGPMYGLYEGAIWFGRRLERKRMARALETD